MASKTLEDLADGFALFDNWEDRYRYLIDLGQRVLPMDDSLKTDELLVRGCTSRVWMRSEIVERDSRKYLHFEADSDAQIVRGLIYILIVAYQDKSLEDVAAIDIEKAFENLGLGGHLSPNRRNGFFSMVEHIRKQCSEA
ncbi:MAG: SufE family protein [Rhodospirillales bacterium]|nr:SufE family protein [Rhodospirillales bacterium]MCB9995912.1 SufE family protein [Rhodospirillales bacterium]